MLEKELLFMDGDLHFMCFMLQNIAYNSSGDIKSLLIKIASHPPAAFHCIARFEPATMLLHVYILACR